MTASPATEIDYGSTLPRIGPQTLPERHLADVIEAFSKRLGYEPMMPWQYHAAANVTALGDKRTTAGERRFSTIEGAVIVSRQNGKTDFAERRALAGLFMGQLVLHTAHNLALPLETFEKLVDRFQQMLPPDSYTLHRRTGREGISVIGGGKYRIRAPKRSGSTMRGGATDLIIIDEYREFDTDDLVEAAKPRMLARDNPQILYLSNAGGIEAQPLRAMRGRAIAGDDSLCWLEWSGDDTASLDDPVALRMANPGIGYILNMDVLAANRKSMAESAYRTEHLCQFIDAATDLAYPLDQWRAGAITEDPDPVRPTVAVDTDPVRRVAVAVAAYPTGDDGMFHVGTIGAWSEPLDDKEIANDVVDLCRNLGTNDLILDPYTSAGIAEQVGLRLNVQRVTRQNIITAGAATFDIISSERLTHLATDELLDAHIAASNRMPTADGGWRITRRGAEPIPGAVAATLALWSAALDKPVPVIY